MKIKRLKQLYFSGLMSLLTCLCAVSWAQDSEEEVVELETFVAGEEVEDDLGLLQTEPVGSVFGFDKSILETPRAVSSISAEFLEEFNVTSINDIVTFVPGTFTTSSSIAPAAIAFFASSWNVRIARAMAYCCSTPL